MSNHLHAILLTDTSLSGIIRDFKKITSKEIIEKITQTNEKQKRMRDCRHPENA